MARRLRSGYTTGACAAAAAKAAAFFFLSGKKPSWIRGQGEISVGITLPGERKISFKVAGLGGSPGKSAYAVVVKDAGDDPDVTHGAEIRADVRPGRGGADAVRLPPPPSAPSLGISPTLYLDGGHGVGRVTKPGLAVGVGSPAINPVPRMMIAEAVMEAVREAAMLPATGPIPADLTVTISVPRGVELAKKTLNARLGILGGISILGTTGIVRPLSTEAWTATITASMGVARAAGLDTIVLSTGRTSERAVQEFLKLPVEAHVMMGDHLRFALAEAARHGFGRIHLSAMWSKLLKAAMGVPQTHVRHGALEVLDILDLLNDLGADPARIEKLRDANTGREVFDRLSDTGGADLIRGVCLRAKTRAEEITGGIPVTVHLIHPTGTLVASV